jgi:RNA polymerase sigma-70 factor (ECF subfamily)
MDARPEPQVRADRAAAASAAEAPSGEAKALWAALIAKHGQAVLLSLLAKGVRLDRAREIAQETWARLFQRYLEGRFATLELPGLAITQAAFLAAEDQRRRRHSRAVQDSEALVALADPSASAEDRLMRRQLLQKATRALDGCSARARSVFTLAYEHPERPHLELAQQVGLSLQRVRQILCEVRAKIRVALEEDSDV